MGGGSVRELVQTAFERRKSDAYLVGGKPGAIAFRARAGCGVFRWMAEGGRRFSTERQFGGVPVVTNRCCSRLRGNHDGSKEKGYWLVTANAGALSREFVAFNGTVAKA